MTDEKQGTCDHVCTSDCQNKKDCPCVCEHDCKDGFIKQDINEDPAEANVCISCQ